MATIRTNAPVKRATLSAVVTRKDGTVENLGVVSYYHRNPLKRWAWQLKKLVKGVLK